MSEAIDHPTPEPFLGAVSCCPEHDELADIALTRSAALPFAENPFRLASVAGVHPDDLTGFLVGLVSLTPAARMRLRVWCSATTSEIARPEYQIPASTRNAQPNAQEPASRAQATSIVSAGMPVPATPTAPASHVPRPSGVPRASAKPMLDGPPCSICGAITYRAGACYLCGACGTSGGCG